MMNLVYDRRRMITHTLHYFLIFSFIQWNPLSYSVDVEDQLGISIPIEDRSFQHCTFSIMTEYRHILTNDLSKKPLMSQIC